MSARIQVRVLMLFALAAVITSCSHFRQVQKSDDWRVRYEAGLEYFEKKDYYRAAVLFEDILPIVTGLPEGETVEFNLAYCQYHEKTFLLSANQFKRFYETYGRSPKAEEARFMYAYSLFASTPSPNLDQQEGIEAMNAMQVFINQYPGSKFAERAIEVIEISQEKLERKGFDNAKQYVKLRNYQAAIISFDNFRNNFPDSRYLEEVAYLKVVAQFRYAEQSLESLQPKRYRTVVEYYQELVDGYPDSKLIKDAERYYSTSLEKLKGKTTNSNT